MVPGPWAPWSREGSAPWISAVGGRGVLSLLPLELPCTLGLHSAPRGEGGGLPGLRLF